MRISNYLKLIFLIMAANLLACHNFEEEKPSLKGISLGSKWTKSSRFVDKSIYEYDGEIRINYLKDKTIYRINFRPNTIYLSEKINKDNYRTIEMFRLDMLRLKYSLEKKFKTKLIEANKSVLLEQSYSGKYVEFPNNYYGKCYQSTDNDTYVELHVYEHYTGKDYRKKELYFEIIIQSKSLTEKLNRENDELDF